MPIKMTFSLSNKLGRFQSAGMFNELSSDLILGVTDIMTTIKNKATMEAPTKRISENIETKITSKRRGNYALDVRARIWVSLAEDKAPEARAYEYGSGIHSTKGPKTKYKIEAKNHPNLKFWWQARNKLFLGPLVMHPGVAAQPYLRPAVEANLPNLREMEKVVSIKVIRNFFRSVNASQ